MSALSFLPTCLATWQQCAHAQCCPGDRIIACCLRYTLFSGTSSGGALVVTVNAAPLSRAAPPVAATQLSSMAHTEPRSTPLREGSIAVVTGAIYGGVHTLSGHWLDNVKARLQLDKSYHNMGIVGAIRRMWTTEGFAAFFRGCVPPLWGSAVYRSIMMSSCVQSHAARQCEEVAWPCLLNCMPCAAAQVRDELHLLRDMVRRDLRLEARVFRVPPADGVDFRHLHLAMSRCGRSPHRASQGDAADGKAMAVELALPRCHRPDWTHHCDAGVDLRTLRCEEG